TAEELAVVVRAAAASRKSPGAWLRELALGAARPDVPLGPPPSTAERLTRTVSTRLTTEQFARLEALAEKCGLPIAACVRRAVVGAPLNGRPGPAGLRPAVAALNREGNNLNQIAKRANKGQ